MLALMLVPIPWVYGWKMKNVNHNAKDHCIACYAAYGASTFANYANETIVHQIKIKTCSILQCFWVIQPDLLMHSVFQAPYKNRMRVQYPLHLQSIMLCSRMCVYCKVEPDLK